MSVQEPSHYAEEDMVLVAGSDYIRMASIGGGVLSIKLPTVGDSTPIVEGISGELLAVNGGTYVDQGRLAVTHIRESGDGTGISLPGNIMMYNPNGNPKEITYSNDIPIRLNTFDVSLNGHDDRLNGLDISVNIIDVSLNGHNDRLNGLDISVNIIDVSLNIHDVSLNVLDVSLNILDTSVNIIDVSLNIIDVSLNMIDSTLYSGSKFAIGAGSSATGTNSFAIGNNATTSTFTGAVAIGNGTTASANNEIKLGSVASFNGDATKGMILGDVGLANETGLQHINLAKNGTSYALTQTSGGNTRINCAGSGYINFYQGGNDRAYISNALHINTAGISYDGTSIASTTNNMVGFRWKNSTQQVMVAVDNSVSGVAASLSDRRVKANIVDYTDALTGIMKLKPKQYDILNVDIANCDFTGDNCIIRDLCGNIIEYDSEGNCCDDTETSGEKMTGLILDELRPIYPEVCIGGDDNSIGTVNYAGLVPMLVKAVQEQQQQIEALKTEMEDLKKI